MIILKEIDITNFLLTVKLIMKKNIIKKKLEIGLNNIILILIIKKKRLNKLNLNCMKKFIELILKVWMMKLKIIYHLFKDNLVKKIFLILIQNLFKIIKKKEN